MNEFDDASFGAYVKAEIAKRDAEVEHLKATHEAQIAERDVQIAKLKDQIEKLKKERGMTTAQDGLTPNDKTGTWLETATGKHHCTRCLLKDDKRVPLKSEPHGWRCMLCAKYYADPDRPEVPLGYGSNPTSWMG